MSSPYVPEGMNYTPFTSPYQEWHDGEEGATPITAMILNYNYDRYLNLLNTFCSDVRTNINKIPDVIPENLVVDASYVHTDNNFTTSLKSKLENFQVEGNPILPVGPTIVMEELETLNINGDYFKITHSGGGSDAPTDGTFYQRTDIWYKIKVVYEASTPAVYSAKIEKFNKDTCTDNVELAYADLITGTTSKTLDDITVIYSAQSEYDNKTTIRIDSYKTIEHGNKQYSSYYETFQAIDGDYLYVVNEFHASEVEANYDLFVPDGIRYSISVTKNNSYGGTARVIKYGGKSIISDNTISVLTGSTDIGDLIITFADATGFTITSDYSSGYFKYRDTLAQSGDDISTLNPGTGETLTFEDIWEGSIGSSAGSLTNIRIDDKVYTISGGGGTTVVANPSGTATADLTKLQVGNDIYAIPSGSSPYTDVTGTLTAGSTSITLSDASITTSSTIEVFDDLDIPYNSKTLSTGSITLTFDAQQSNMSVKVRVS